jgi:hypothetical protein
MIKTATLLRDGFGAIFARELKEATESVERLLGESLDAADTFTRTGTLADAIVYLIAAEKADAAMMLQRRLLMHAQSHIAAVDDVAMNKIDEITEGDPSCNS